MATQNDQKTFIISYVASFGSYRKRMTDFGPFSQMDCTIMFRFLDPLPHNLPIMFASTQSWIERLSDGAEEDRQQTHSVFRSDRDREWSQRRLLRL